MSIDYYGNGNVTVESKIDYVLMNMSFHKIIEYKELIS